MMVAFASLSLGYTFRIVRWGFLLRLEKRDLSWKVFPAPFLGAIALNNLLPLRAGDIVRSFVFPRAMGVTKTASFVSLIAERAFDIVALTALLAVGLVASDSVQMPQMLLDLTWIAFLSAACVLVVGLIWASQLSGLIKSMAQSLEPSYLSRFLADTARFLDSFSRLSSTVSVVTVTLLTSFVWFSEAGAFFFIMMAAKLPASLPLAMLVTAIATLSTLIPSTPGYFGPFHLATLTTLVAAGFGEGAAGSYALMMHLCLWVPTSIVGMLMICLNPLLFSRSARNAQPAIDI